MKLNDFDAIQIQEECEPKKFNWNLMFVVGVFSVLSICFVYDAYKEQHINTDTVVAIK